MNTAAQRVLISSVLYVLLALGVTLRDDDKTGKNQQLFTSPTECCDVKTLPLMNKIDNQRDSCDGFPKDDSDQSVDCSVECTLSENDMLNENKTIKEDKLREFFIDRAPPDAKSVTRAMFDDCFAQYENHDKLVSCGSGVDELFICVVIGVIANCPDSLWHEANPQCKAARELTKSSVVTAATLSEE